MNNEQLNFTNKQTWTKNNFSSILKRLGFIETTRAKNALQKFIEENHVQEAKVTAFLGPLAISFLNKERPPLLKHSKSSLSLNTILKK